MRLVPLVSPTSEADLVTTVALLDAHGIPTHVQGGWFGSLLPGPLIPSYNAKTILVPEELLRDARDLLATPVALPDFDDEPEPPPAAASSQVKSTLRVLVELLLFGWFIPRK